MRLVVTEKPSVARDLARVLGATRGRDGFLEGDGLRVTWCVGHLLELQEPGHYDPAWKSWSLGALPMLPERFALRVRQGAEDQWTVVERLLRDPAVGEVINACDAGREGELIFRYAYDHAGCRHPVRRFWVSSLTDEAVRAGWAALQPGERFDALAAAARSRSEADWIVGLNATRAMTCRTREAGGDALWSVGRVQTPTLAMIVARDREIAAFVPERYWRVEAALEATGVGWKAAWFRQEAESRPAARDETPHEERVGSAEDAQAIAEAARGREGHVATATRRTRSEPPPLLYDLTSLQRRANQRYGLSAQHTLDLAQALYEKHKLLTYPRTDARHLTSDQVGELPGILQAVGEVAPYRPHVEAILAAPLRTGRRLVDDAEVGDHHAIVPTGRAADPARLSADEKRIYDLVARRLLAALSPDAVIDLAELIVAVPPAPEVTLPADVPAPLTFRAKGRVVRQAGWQAVDPPRKQRDVDLPAVEVGDRVQVAETTPQEGETRPPRPHDDASLLRGMETAGKGLDDAELRRALRQAGLGTPATRAAILQTLIGRDYARRDGRALRATEKGCALIDAVPAEELKSAELTGRWEHRLARIAEGSEAREPFMQDVGSHAARIVEAIRGATLPEAALVRTRPDDAPVLGACPACGTPVRKRGPVYACETGRSCPFVVFGTMSRRVISATMVKELLTHGRTKVVKGFKSKAGKPFEAGLVVEEGGKVGFAFEDRPASAAGAGPRRPRDGEGRQGASGHTSALPARAPAPSAPSAPEGLSCPSCGRGNVLRGRAAWGCSRWNEGCGWRLPFKDGERAVSEAEAVQRILGG